MVLGLPSRPRGPGLALERAGRGGPAPALAPPRPPHQGDPPPDARRGGVPLPLRRPRSVEVPPGPPLRPGPRRPHLHRRLRAGGVDDRGLRRQLELARAGLVPHELPHHPVAPLLPQLLRGRLQGRVPHGLRRPPDPEAGGGRPDPPPDPPFPPRRFRPAPLRRPPPAAPGRPPLQGSPPVLRVLPRRPRVGPGGGPPD